MPIAIFTGSTLGGAEYVADHLSSLLSEQGIENHIFNQPTLDDLLPQSHLLLVTSTHGAGEFPENIQPLFTALAEQQNVDLSQLHFGIVGLGSSDYDTFCNAVNLAEQSLLAKGAKQLCPSLRIDVVTNFDHDETAGEWLPSFVNALTA